MANQYNIKLKKGDVEIEVFGPDKEFVSNKFKESILVAFEKSNVLNEVVNQLPVQVAEQAVLESAVLTEEKAVEPVVEAIPVQEAVNNEVVQVEAVMPVVEAVPEQTVILTETAPVVESVQPEAVLEPVVEAPVQEIKAEPVVEAIPVVEAVKVENVAPVEAAPVQVEAAQTPQVGKSALANVLQMGEDDLLKIFGFGREGFKVQREFEGSTALKQINTAKIILAASEYLNGITQLSGKALGKHMKKIGTGNLATNLKKDNGIVKEKGFYRLNEAGKKAAFDLIKELAK